MVVGMVVRTSTYHTDWCRCPGARGRVRTARQRRLCDFTLWGLCQSDASDAVPGASEVAAALAHLPGRRYHFVLPACQNSRAGWPGPAYRDGGAGGAGTQQRGDRSPCNVGGSGARAWRRRPSSIQRTRDAPAAGKAAQLAAGAAAPPAVAPRHAPLANARPLRLCLMRLTALVLRRFLPSATHVFPTSPCRLLPRSCRPRVSW